MQQPWDAGDWSEVPHNQGEDCSIQQREPGARVCPILEDHVDELEISSGLQWWLLGDKHYLLYGFLGGARRPHRLIQDASTFEQSQQQELAKSAQSAQPT